MSDIPTDLTREDLFRVTVRDNYVKGELANRVAALVKENLELLSIIQEIQQDLAALRQSQQVLPNGEVEVMPHLIPQDVPHPEAPAGVIS